MFGAQTEVLVTVTDELIIKEKIKERQEYGSYNTI